MLKRVILLKRKPGFARGDMLHYWQHVHAPLAMGFPEWFESTQRYAQNHFVEQVAGGAFDFDGMVESWQRGGGGVGSSFPDSRAYKEVLGPDELNFMDRASSVLLFVEERLLMARTGEVKLLTFLARRAGVTAEAFGAQWLEDATESLKLQPGLWRRVRGCAQNLFVPGSMKVLGAPASSNAPPPPLAIDGIAEMRFDSMDDLSATLATDDYAALESGQLTFSLPAIASVVVREVTLYDRSAGPQA